MSKSPWYKIVAYGFNSAVHRNEQDAWKSFERMAWQIYGYRDCEMGTAYSAHRPRLVKATTRRAARYADISYGGISYGGGTIGQGEWWYVTTQC